MAEPLRQANAKPKTVSVLGSTGSVGCNTLDLVRRNAGAFVIEALTAGRNVELLAAQVREFRPKLAVIGDESRYRDLKDALAGTETEVAAGTAAVAEAAARPADWVMSAIVGAAG
ncbi:MAG: 1-deoxy-D-xylulose-5-phosphate reductoisomerase, partial [Alphaproteobacteria bacterium]